MNFKRIFLGLFAALCLAESASAAPADQRPRKVRQADGTYITVIKRGDEFGHVTMTTDGYPLFYNESTGNYEYAKMSSSTLESSGIIAADAADRNVKAVDYLKSVSPKAMLSKLEVQRAARASVMRYRPRHMSTKPGAKRGMLINDYPSIGSPNVLIILVQFSDMTFDCEDGDPLGFYKNMFTQPGFKYKNGANGSVLDYFTTSSNGLFNPRFDIVGPVTLPKSYSYYGANYSGNDRMDRLQEFVKGACEAASKVVDFSKYDNNGDGYVDNVYLYYAGFGEADSEYKESIWPHAYNYNQFKMGSLKFNGVSIGSYTCSPERSGTYPELPTGIGTFCHEFSHVLGLPDHYTTVYNDAFTPGEFDVMDMGTYNNEQNTPPTHSAYERAELGWLEYQELTTGADTISVLPELQASNKAYIVPVEGTNGREFFVLENRQKTGWDKYLPGNGMLMWHIDQDANVWAQNTVNNDPNHQRVDLIEADGKLTAFTLAGDPFPGTANVKSYTMTAWDNRDILRLDNIDEVDGEIQLLVANTKFAISAPELSYSEVADSSFVVSWKATGKASRYVLNIYKVVGSTREAVSKYTNIEFAAPDTFVVEGLEPDTQYDVELTACIGSYTSEPATATISTLPLAFAKRMPVNLAAKEVGTDHFTVAWDEVPTADDYVVELNMQNYSTESVDRGYDFAQRGVGMPALWKYSGAWMNVKQYCGKAAPALQMSKAGNFLMVAYPDAQIESLSFFLSATKGASGNVSVERYEDGKWLPIETVAVGDGFTADTHSMKFAASDSVRIVFNRTLGSVFVDDVDVVCHDIVRTAVPGYESVSTGGVAECKFAGLNPATRYGIVVTAKNGEEKSIRSSELIVTTSALSGIKGVSIDNGSQTIVYDLNGCRVNNADATHGVYIVRKGGKAYKVVK